MKWRMARSFDSLVEDAAAVTVEGWDFGRLDGRATEERPSWGYQRLLRTHLAVPTAALDIQTGGGEVLAGVRAENFPPTMVATEGWQPNVTRATALLHPLGAVVVADPDEPHLPFADAAFDLVSSRHPASVHWSEIARVLKPTGTYFAQHVGSRTNLEFFDVGAMVFFLRKVTWTVPDFTVDRFRERLRDLHDQIGRVCVFHSTMSRTLFEARKPSA